MDEVVNQPQVSANKETTPSTLVNVIAWFYIVGSILSLLGFMGGYFILSSGIDNFTRDILSSFTTQSLPFDPSILTNVIFGLIIVGMFFAAFTLIVSICFLFRYNWARILFMVGLGFSIFSSIIQVIASGIGFFQVLSRGNAGEIFITIIMIFVQILWATFLIWLIRRLMDEDIVAEFTT